MGVGVIYYQILTPHEKSSYQEQREGVGEFREEGGEAGGDVHDAEDEHHCERRGWSRCIYVYLTGLSYYLTNLLKLIMISSIHTLRLKFAIFQAFYGYEPVLRPNRSARYPAMTLAIMMPAM